jgi:hypothetical protein
MVLLSVGKICFTLFYPKNNSSLFQNHLCYSMKTQQKDYYHGAPLTQIVEHKSFTALNKVDKKYGHYKINDNIRLMVKIATVNSPSSNKDRWKFTFSEDDFDVLENDMKSEDKFFICFVCGETTICLLNHSDINQILDFSNKKPQSIHVEKRGSLWLTGPCKRKLDRAIPHKDFPDKLFIDSISD